MGRYGFLCLLFLFCLSVVARGEDYQLFKPLLEANAKKGSPEAVLLQVVDEFISDIEATPNPEDGRFEIMGRESEADAVLDVLVRMKGAAPILIGPAGVGKTTTVQRATQKVVAGEFPGNVAYRKVLKNSVWVSTSAGKLMQLVSVNNPAGRMEAIDLLFDSILKLEAKYDRRIVLYIDEIHNLDKDQVEAMLPFLGSLRKGILLVGSTNSDKFQLKFKDNDAWLRRIQQIGIEEFSEERTLEVLKRWWVPSIQKRFRVKFDEDTLLAGIRNGIILQPEAGRFDASVNILQDVAIRQLRARSEEAKRAPITVSDKAVYDFVQKRTGYPVNPHDGPALLEYINGLRDKLKQEILDQPRMVDDVLAEFQGVLTSRKKGLRVGILVGPTGTGKSELGVMLAKYAFNNEKAFLRIDANEYKSGASALMKLFGAEGGLVTSDTRSGIMPTWFDDPSQGKYGGVILIDEGERAGPEFWERLMEFMDGGSFVGGDGKRRYARRHILLITSNRGDRILFPEGANQWSEQELATRLGQITPEFLKNLFRQKISGKDDFSLPDAILNRADRFTVSCPILRSTAKKIVAKELHNFILDTEKEYRVQVEIDERLVDYLANLDYQLRDGARPIIRRVKNILENARVQAMGPLNLQKGSVLRIALEFDNKDQASLCITNGDEKRIDVPLPRRIVEDIFADRDTIEKLKGLRDSLPKKVIGQTQAVQSISRAIISHMGSGMNKKRPFAAFLAGPTGVGKTEMGKALAELLYGSRDRAGVIELGEVYHESEFTHIFGSSPGYIGSDQERKFEKFLVNNPNGGVLIWDEASNLGGQDKGLKDAFFRKLLSLLEEGKWTSPATGTTYDLGKYVFLFTGNDGEDLFFGTQSDAIKMAIWGRNNDRESVRQMLRKRGIPEPFIGRMVDIILMKPLLRSEVNAIAHMQIDPILDKYRARGITFVIEDGFYDRFAESFFGTTTGARSLRSVAEYRLDGILTEALMRANYRSDSRETIEIRMALTDGKPTRPFRLRNDPKRTVMLKVEAFHNNNSCALVEEDLVEFAHADKWLPVKLAMEVAFHEAGHAVMNRPEVTGESLRYLTILGDSTSLGFASYEQDEDAAHLVPGKKIVVARLARLLAGQAALVMAGYEPNIGWSSDLRKVRQIASTYVRDYGMVAPFYALLTDEDGNIDPTDEQKAQMWQMAKDLIDEGGRQAEETLRRDWPLVKATVKRLLKQGFLERQDFETLRREFEASRAARIGGSQPRRGFCQFLGEAIGG